MQEQKGENLTGRAGGKMNNRNLIIILVLSITAVIAASCAPKKELVPPVSQAQLSAEAAIKAAEEAIEDARVIGVDVADAKDLLARARDSFTGGDFAVARTQAEHARWNALTAKQIFLAEKHAREREEKEKAARKPPIAAREVKLYTVGTWQQERDCLWNIAKKKDIYNDPWKWKKIYQANRDKIEDPDLIYPQQKFIIP